MKQAEFEAKLRKDGFEVSTSEMKPNHVSPSHAHDFDVAAFVLEGDIKLTCGGTARTYKAGDHFAMTAGTLHEEHVGAAGMRYIVGRRHKS